MAGSQRTEALSGPPSRSSDRADRRAAWASITSGLARSSPASASLPRLPSRGKSEPTLGPDVGDHESPHAHGDHHEHHQPPALVEANGLGRRTERLGEFSNPYAATLHPIGATGSSP